MHNGVNCPFNFQSPSGWEDTFAHYPVSIAESVDLGLDIKIVPEYHWLYALDTVQEQAGVGRGAGGLGAEQEGLPSWGAGSK